MARRLVQPAGTGDPEPFLMNQIRVGGALPGFSLLSTPVWYWRRIVLPNEGSVRLSEKYLHQVKFFSLF